MTKEIIAAGSSAPSLGRRVTTFEGFDTFPTPDDVHTVKCVSNEVTANCPVTEQPDWYKVEISYAPDELCIESKTLKLYLQSFRNQGHFCEKFASIIAADIARAINPKWVEVAVIQTPRGGVGIEARARRTTGQIL